MSLSIANGAGRLDTLKQQIERELGRLPRQLAKIGRYCLDHPQTVALSKIGELASAVGVHPSALVRFGQSFGFSGFSDFQAVFRESMLAGWPEYGSRIDQLISRGEEPETLVDKFIDVSIQSLQSLKEGIDRIRLNNALKLLANAKKIYVIGQKRSFPVAFYFAYALRKLDIHSALIESNGGLLMERASWCRPEDALIAISFTPYAPGTLDVTTELARRGLTIVSITDSRFSPLIPLSTEWIELVEQDWSGFRSMSATLAVAMTLSVGVAELRGLDSSRDNAVAGINDWTERV